MVLETDRGEIAPPCDPDHGTFLRADSVGNRTIPPVEPAILLFKA
jgi:hypothetical protein